MTIRVDIAEAFHRILSSFSLNIIEDSFEKSLPNARRPSVVRDDGRHPLQLVPPAALAAVVEAIAKGGGGGGLGVPRG